MLFSRARGFGLSLARGQVRRVSLLVGVMFAVLPAGAALAAIGRAGNANALPATAATRAASTTARAVSAGGDHTCALTDSDAVKCWGSNFYGQLGDGTKADSSVPVEVKGLGSGVAEISAGYHHTCALMYSGAVKCWGGNGEGQLGDGTKADSLVPVKVKGLGSGVAAISAGYHHTCALMGSGAVECWGSNFYGQLGDGTKADSLVPVEVKGLGSGVAEISAGYHHTCARTDARAVKCWGDNSAGQLGDATKTDSLVPVDVRDLGSGVAAISAGGDDTCALTVSGAVKCWGSNHYGQDRKSVV